jgi:tetratricopeptide (TPR) repeat protein
MAEDERQASGGESAPPPAFDRPRRDPEHSARAGDARPRRLGPRDWLDEVRRRKVPRAAVAYLVGVFGVFQGVQVLISAFELNPRFLTWVVVLGAIGFPLNLLLAWHFDIFAPSDAPAGPVPESAFPGGAERRVRLRKPTWAAIAAMALVAAGLATWRLWPRERPPPKAQTVLIADLENRTGEYVFDGTLEPVLGIALEGASFVSTFRRDVALRIADQARFEGTGLGEKRARLVAQREGIGVVTAGAIDRSAKGYRVGVRAVDAFTGVPVVEATEEATSKDAVLAAATRLAARIRAALGDTVPESVQLTAGETYSAGSLEAAHEYALGMNAQFAGKWDDAVRHYEQALRLDRNMGRAYAGLAVIENNRGRHAEASRYFKEAMARVDRMSEREKFRSRGAYYLVVDRDPDRAIEALAELVKRFPADNAGLANLAVAYQLKRDFPRALEEARRAVAIYPKIVQQRNNVGLFAMYLGDFDAAIQEQQKVLELNPGFENGYVGLALAQLAAGRPDDAASTWSRLAGLGAAGASSAAEGLADLALYQGRLGDARALLEKGAQADLAAKDGAAAARKLAMLAEALLAGGKGSQAAAAADRALQSAGGHDYVLFAAARVLARAGEERKARAVADDLDRRLPPESRMYAELLRGEAELRRRSFPEAVERYRGALRHVDSWLARCGLGHAYLEAGAFTQAQEELERCKKRRGEATDAFLDVVPTYRYWPEVEYRLGRAQEGLGSPGAAESYRAFLAAKTADEDPAVPDARRRLGKP